MSALGNMVSDINERMTWKLGFRNLLRNRRRSLATGLAISFGYCGLILLSAYIYRAQKGLEGSTVYLNHRGHIAIMKDGAIDFFQAKPKKYLISKDEQEKIYSFLKGNSILNNNIEWTSAYLSGMGLIQIENKSTPFMATGIDPDAYARTMTHPYLKQWAKDWVQNDYGSDFREMERNISMVSITKKMANLLNVKPPFTNLPGNQHQSSDSVQLIAQNYYRDLNALSAELGPVHSTGLSMLDETSMIMPLSKLQELYATDGIQYLALFLKDPDQFRKNLKIINQWLSEQNSEDNKLVAYGYTDEKWSPYYVGTMSFLLVMGIMFAVLICGSVALSIINSTAMGILERTREVGTLRAIGYLPQTVRLLFVKEALVLSFFSCIAGALGAVVIATVVNSSHLYFHPPGTQGAIQFLLILDGKICFELGLMLMIINCLTSYFTTSQQMKKKVIQLLSDSGV